MTIAFATGCAFGISGQNSPVDDIGALLKPRIVVLTDIAPGDCEPDDMESVVRLLSHADLFEIEAIITCSGWNSGGRAYPDDWTQYLHTVIDAYREDLPNLMKRSGQEDFQPLDKENTAQVIGYWPSADYISGRHFMGSRFLGVDRLGADNVSPGSNEIIRLAVEDDPRPLWLLVWGGGNTVAQSLWQLKETTDDATLNSVLDKIRIYTITDQDVDWTQRGQYGLSSHKWMRETFDDRLFFIWDESAWLSQNEIGAKNWSEYAAKIQDKGKMGGVYPKYKYGVEGDTPSFLYVLPNGLHDPEEPWQAGWGGYFRYELSPDSSTMCHINWRDDIRKVSRKYEEYFYPAVFNNFVARMQWADQGKGNRNPVVVVNGQRGLSPVLVRADSGDVISLDSAGTYDPDGDSVDVKWWVMGEVGAYVPPECLLIDGDGKASLFVPSDCSGQEIHVICEVTDLAQIPLTSYRRIIVKVGNK